MTEITWPFDVSVFEKFRFQSSTLHHLAGVFKFLRSILETVSKSFVFGDQNHRFSVDRTVGQTGEKRCIFKFLRISVDGALTLRCSKFEEKGNLENNNLENTEDAN